MAYQHLSGDFFLFRRWHWAINLLNLPNWSLLGHTLKTGLRRSFVNTWMSYIIRKAIPATCNREFASQTNWHWFLENDLSFVFNIYLQMHPRFQVKLLSYLEILGIRLLVVLFRSLTKAHPRKVKFNGYTFCNSYTEISVFMNTINSSHFAGVNTNFVQFLFFRFKFKHLLDRWNSSSISSLTKETYYKNADLEDFLSQEFVCNRWLTNIAVRLWRIDIRGGVRALSWLRHLETNTSFWLCWRRVRRRARDSYVNYYTLWLRSSTKTTPNTTKNIQRRKIAVNLLPSLV